MITIFNKKLKHSIQWDDNDPSSIRFNNYDYLEDDPYIMIEFLNFNFFSHSQTCETCRSLMDDFGGRSIDWFISYYNKIKRLDLTNFANNPLGNKSQYSFTPIETCHILKLKISRIPNERDQLIGLLVTNEQIENYEQCVIYKRALNDMD